MYANYCPGCQGRTSPFQLETAKTSAVGQNATREMESSGGLGT